MLGFDPNLMQQMMGQMFGGSQPANPQANQQNPNQQNANPFSSLLGQLMGGGMPGSDAGNLFGGGFGAPNPYTPPANLRKFLIYLSLSQRLTFTSENMSPEARYAVQLQQLNDMGFYDQEKNVRSLVATGF